MIGNVTLPGDVKLPLGTTLTFTDGSTITVPSGVTFTNNGTITGDIHVTTNGTTVCTGHTGGTASCTQEAKCLVCGNEYGKLRTTHKLTKTESKEATTTEKGSKHEVCSVCGYVKAAVDIPVIATEPTTATESTTATTPTTGTGNLTTPQTGDNSHVALWVCLLMVSAFGVVAMFLYERNRKAEG